MLKKLSFPKKLILITIIPVLLLTGYLLLATNILAADDNANEAQCADFENDCDGEPDECSGYGFTYTTSGYPMSTGNPNCCGDTSNKIFFITA